LPAGLISPISTATSRWTFASLIGDPEGVADNLVHYIEHSSPNVRDVFDGFRMMDQIADLAKSDRLYLIVKEFPPSICTRW